MAAGLACVGVQARPSADAQAQHRLELAACNSGASPEGRSTCITETQAAYAQEQRGTLNEHDDNYERNAMMRCDALNGSDRHDCIVRIQGGGTTSGSVAGGGIFRELVTRTISVPVEPVPTAPQ